MQDDNSSAVKDERCSSACGLGPFAKEGAKRRLRAGAIAAGNSR